MPECTIEIKDEVNVKIHDLDLATRRQLEKEFKYFLPHAYHVPAYKLGRWDGCGKKYLNFFSNCRLVAKSKSCIFTFTSSFISIVHSGIRS
jgi:hypothetical protein